MSFWYLNGVCSNNLNSRRLTKTTGPKTYRRAGAFVALCCVGIGVVAQAQDTLPPGLLATLDITQRLEYSDNPDLDEVGNSDFFGRTVLNFGLRSETSLDSFAFNIGTDIEEFRDDQSSVDFTNSFLRLNYGRATQNARIGAVLRYRESDTSSNFFDNDFDRNGNVINQSDGTRKSYGFGLNGATGINAPIGASFTFDYDEITFSDTTDPDLTDESFLDFSGRINLRLDPRIVARLTAIYEDYDAQGNGVNRETTGIGVGAAVDISKTLQGDFELRYDNIERTGDEVGTDDGLTFIGGLTQATTNGSWGVRLESDVSTNDDGRRNFFSVRRSVDLPRGALAYSIGGTNSETSDFDPLFNVNYTHDRSDSQLIFGLSQAYNTNRDNEEQINTTLNAGYRYEINNLSSLRADFTFRDRNDIGQNADDGQRLDLSLSYEYALTQDWGIVAGYSYILEKDDDDDDRTSNTVFIGLQRNFSWNP